MKVVIDSDETGAALKQAIAAYLSRRRFEFIMLNSADQYPDVAFRLARRVASGEFDRGILICGTGVGMAIAANKVRGVFAANCPWDVKLARRIASSNSVNVITLGSEYIHPAPAKRVIRAYLETPLGDRPNARRMRELEAQQ